MALFVPFEWHSSEGRSNNFNLLRILAALCVLISHSYPLSQGLGAPEPLSSFLPDYNLGRLAVWTFFIISGFFVSRSFACRRSIGEYAVARFLRIYPALLTALCISAFIVGPLYTDLSARNYFGSAAPVIYILKGLSLTYFNNPLPGVFSHNPVPAAVNNPLWTLYYEALCYALVVAIGLLCRRNSIFAAAALAYFAVYFYLSWLNLHEKLVKYAEILGYIRAFTMPMPFVLGMIFYRFRDRIPYSIVLAVMAAGAICILRGNAYFIPLFIVFWSYIVMYLGFLPSGPLLNYNKAGDYSYGIYIYAWTVGQIIMSYAGTTTALRLMEISIPLTLACAFFSWHCIEKHALRLRPRIADFLSPRES